MPAWRGAYSMAAIPTYLRNEFSPREALYNSLWSALARHRGQSTALLFLPIARDWLTKNAL